MRRIKPPVVACPRAAVREAHDRQGFVGDAVAVAVAVRRERVVEDHAEPVARGDRRRVHGHERLILERGTVGEEVPRLAARRLVEVVGDRPVVGGERDHPVPVIEAPARDLDLAASRLVEDVQVRPDRLVEDLPLLALVHEGGGLDRARGRVADDVGEVGALVLGEELSRAALGVDRVERRRVAVAAVAHVERAARLVEPERVGRHRVRLRDVLGLRPLAVVAGKVHVDPAVLGHLVRPADAQAVVGQDLDESIVLQDEFALARRDVEPVEVVPLGVAVVERDENGVRGAAAHLLDTRVDPFQRCEVTRLAAREIGRVDPPVLVSSRVLEVEDVAVGEGPREEADAASGVVRDGLRRGDVLARRDPDVEHAVSRGEPGELLAVRADADARAFRVTEDQFAGYE